MGELQMSVIVSRLTLMSVISAPSTVSNASPRLWTNRHRRTVIWRNPPLLSVPSLIRPVGPSPSGAFSVFVVYVPSKNEPTS